MYAVIEAGGRQYKVSEGDVIIVDKLDGDVCSAVTFDKVLLTGGDATTIGQPLVAGASVTGEITAQGRDKKVIIFKSSTFVVTGALTVGLSPTQAKRLFIGHYAFRPRVDVQPWMDRRAPEDPSLRP